MEGKSLPNNVRAEQEILGSVLGGYTDITRVIDQLNTTDFYSEKNQKIYIAMCTLFAESKEINITSIIDALGRKEIEKIGVSYLTSLLESGFKIDITQHCKMIKKASLRREGIRAARETIIELFDDTKEPVSVINELTERITKDTNTKNKVVDNITMLSETLEKIEERYNNGGQIQGMQTGYKTLDKALSGLHEGELFVIAGRPAMGKTATILQLAEGLAKNGNTPMIFEMEMSKEQLGNRRIAAASKISLAKIKNGLLDSKEFDKVAVAFNSLSNNEMYIDDSSYQNALTIRSKLKVMKKKNPNLKVAIIDHLTLMDIGDSGNRSNDIGKVTRALKIAAKDLGICVILLCQLSRACEQRADKRPMLSDLRESGNIEQDADNVMFIYRDEYYNKDTNDKNVMEWIIAKQRDGATGVIKQYYNGDYQFIGDLW